MVTANARLALVWQWLISTFAKATVELCPKHSNCSLFWEPRVITSLPFIAITYIKWKKTHTFVTSPWKELNSTTRKAHHKMEWPGKHCSWHLRQVGFENIVWPGAFAISDSWRSAISFYNSFSPIALSFHGVNGCLGSHKAKRISDRIMFVSALCWLKGGGILDFYILNFFSV